MTDPKKQSAEEEMMERINALKRFDVLIEEVGEGAWKRERIDASFAKSKVAEAVEIIKTLHKELKELRAKLSKYE